MLWPGRSAIVVMQGALDSRALEIAAGVAANQSRHETECRDRYIAIENALNRQDDRFDKAIDKINSLLWKVALGVAFVLLGVIGWLLIQLYAQLAVPKGMHTVAQCCQCADRSPGET